MVHSGIFCTKAEIDVKVGENVDATGYTEANINNSCAQAESMINALTRFNFSDRYASINVDTKRILSEAAACWVACDFISYNMGGYTSRIEAENMINLQWAKSQFLIKLLQDSKTAGFVDGA